ncbi:MAG TPA: biotin--[acetyl-CoA-carboxylase] ligase, partial [Syntrophales bacterium]|nr:biotin--[acetyl-CoA-carboxylase] ligase [Syntrophales bacterium]
GCNIYCSIALRPAIAPLYAPQITLMTGVVVADLVSRYCPGVTLKWPNDVEIGGKKICGILTEMSAHRQDKVDFIVVGIGVNVNIRRNDLDGTIRDTATSLADETGQNVSRLDLAVRLFDRFDALYAQLMHAGFGPVKDAWLSCCGMMGKQVKVVFNNSVESGKVTGIDDYGALLISDEKGGIKRIMAGDASVLKT